MMLKLSYKELREYFDANMSTVPTEFDGGYIKYSNMRKNVQQDLQLIDNEMQRLGYIKEQVIKSAPIRAAVGRLRRAHGFISASP